MTHLPKLKSLKQLRFDPRSLNHRYDGETGYSGWEDNQLEEATAMRYVQWARSLSPSLEYAQVDSWAWQITVPEGAVLNTQVAIHSQVRLRRLGHRERMSIELFSFADSVSHAGLLRYGEPKK